MDYRIVEGNPAFERQTGLVDAIGKWVSETAPELERHWFDIYGGVALTGKAVRFENEAKTFGRWYDVHAFRTGEPEEQRVAVLFTDISHRRRVELELRELNETLETRVAERTAERDRAWKNSRDLQVVIGPDGVFRAANEAWDSILGWRADTVIGRNWTEFTHPDDIAACRQVLERASGESARIGETEETADTSSSTVDIRFRHRDGGFRLISWLAQNEGGLTYGSGRDVTAERQRQAELARTEDALRLYENIVQSDEAPVVAFDRNRRVIAFNSAHAKAYSQLFGRKPKVGDHLPDHMPQGQAALLTGLMDRALAGETFTVIEEFGPAGGDKTCFEISYTPLRNQDGEIVGAFHHARDVTARLRAETELTQAQEALRQSQKMEAVGQLTGGLAHDFNNLLAGMSGSLELMQTRLSQGRVVEIDRYLTAAQESARRAAALTHRLLAFSRRQTLDPKPTRVDQLIAGMEELIRRTMGPAIAVETQSQSDLWATLVDPNQLENALLNLCINARDAMPDGGKLAIRTSNEVLDERAAREIDLAAGSYIAMTVADTGSGMPLDVIERAFDPFFTTKPIGLGTGLGLSMTYGFARQSGGQVRIVSEVGHGTTISLYLPRHEGIEPVEEPDRSETERTAANVGRTVLVVDDEPLVRMLVVDVLEELDCQVLEAGDGPEAMAILRSGKQIDLLITDVGLPNGMNGRQIAEAARQMQPEVKVLFITGYAENAVLSHGHLELGMHVMTKPFQMDALAEKIRSISEDMAK
ncbi:PAS domain-containing protein [Pseudohoeflea sp. DP4N28-3]|uniref:histidine kinase n=1 Tax=Pseudohoeflea coraliihabitans TaxID=2860393 RepID=A0ABS6WPB6_9HYPH|nr:PAS domain-containing protein [Pseudohoeflea sp. DP4N28-3]